MVVHENGFCKRYRRLCGLYQLAGYRQRIQYRRRSLSVLRNLFFAAQLDEQGENAQYGMLFPGDNPEYTFDI